MTSKSYLGFAASPGKRDLVALQVKYMKQVGLEKERKQNLSKKKKVKLQTVKKVKVNV